MQFSAMILLGAVVATGSAQNLGALWAQVPPCSQTCVNKYFSQVCGHIENYACICSRVVELAFLLEPCVLASCTAAEAIQCELLGHQACSSVDAYQASLAAASTASTETATGVNPAETTTTLFTVLSSMAPSSSLALPTSTTSSPDVILPISTSSSLILSSATTSSSPTIMPSSTSVTSSSTSSASPSPSPSPTSAELPTSTNETPPLASPATSTATTSVSLSTTSTPSSSTSLATDEAGYESATASSVAANSVVVTAYAGGAAQIIRPRRMHAVAIAVAAALFL